MKPFILLENRKGNPEDSLSLYFTNPVEEIIVYEPEQLLSGLKQVENARRKGYYLLGFLSYEAGYSLSNSLETPYCSHDAFPLLHFMLFEGCEYLTKHKVETLLLQLDEHIEECFAYNIHLNVDEETYQKNIKKIKQHLHQGDTYQVNYTAKFKFDLQGQAISLYRKLRDQQKVEYSALFYTSDYQIVSLSPELFFVKQNDTLTVRPMKGTTPRSNDAEQDALNKARLASDPKLIAENIIVVDLLRNDLNTVSLPGSVTVSKLLELETYETVHQTTSTIHSKLDPNTPFGTIVQRLFPSGSITGAPKRRTMQIIQDCESEARRIYTGTIGYIMPNNDMCFSVAIRTLLLRNQQGELGVGGAILVDSNAQEELDELKLKARFFLEMDVDYKLIESIRYKASEGYFLLDQHLARLSNSARIFNFSFDANYVKHTLDAWKSKLVPTKTYKIRVIAYKHGKLEVDAVVINDEQLQEKRYAMLFEAQRVNSQHALLQHKTTDSSIRRFYDAHTQQYPQFYDLIFMNERGEITEGSRTNIFIQLDGCIITPLVTCGLLPGIMRNSMLANDTSIQQRCIYKDDLLRAEKIWLTNSVRGIQEVFLWTE